jgi:carbamoyltransferase
VRELRLRTLPGLTDLEQYTFQGLDSTAALVHDGTVVAAIQEERLNSLVRKWEPFRPFAPAMMREQAPLFFEVPECCALPYTRFPMPARREREESIPAVVHVAGLARLRALDQAQHPLFWRFLDAFEQVSGVPVLLNNSFNVKGQPIVCTPRDALDTFLNTEISTLVLGSYLCSRQGAP